MKLFKRGQNAKKISMDELESLKDVLDETKPDTDSIPTLSNVVKEQAVAAQLAAANSDADDYDARLTESLDALHDDGDDDIPMLTDITEAATPFELVGGALTAPTNDASKAELYAQMEQEAERLLDEIVTRHMPLIRDELMVRLEDVKQTLLNELNIEER